MDPGVDLVHIYTSMEGDTGESKEFETAKKYFQNRWLKRIKDIYIVSQN